MQNGEQHEDREKLVTVKAFHNEVEANIVRSLLESAGIQCTLITPVPHGLYPFTIDGLAEIRVSVLEPDLDAARTIIEDYEQTASEEPLPPDTP